MKHTSESMNGVNPDEDRTLDHGEELQPNDYIRAVNFHLLRGNPREAYAVLKQAAVFYPDDPFVLSYYGNLQATTDKKHRSGIENCTRAIALYRKKALARNVERYAVLYLNLGRAYLAAENKKDAINAFKKGLQYDHTYSAIIKKLEQLGSRGRPVVSFLDRSNPINKYLGMILYKDNATRPDAMRNPERNATG